MQAAIEFAPWVIFGLVYKFGGGIYPATASLMGAMALLLAYDWLSARKIPRIAPGAGHPGLGLWHCDSHPARRALLQWKALGFLLVIRPRSCRSAFIGRQTLLEQMLGKTLPEGFTVPPSTWRNSSLSMGGSTSCSAWPTSGWR